MHYHVLLTHRCNLACAYCGDRSHLVPQEPVYSIERLARFIEKDPKPVIAFYGGEPLLRADLVRNIMDAVPATYFVQTNGLLLDTLEPEYLNRFQTILISLDGQGKVTDWNRGKGVYDRVVEKTRFIRKHGFKGDLLARMTHSLGGDIHEDVMHLAKLPGPESIPISGSKSRPMFDHIHWQLDFELFWEGAYSRETVRKWLDVSYNPGITRLVDDWVEWMEEKGEVLGLAPFQGMLNYLLDNRPANLRCGSGLPFFTIAPSGGIYACPESVGLDDAWVGSIFDSTPESLRDSCLIREPCTSCETLTKCGGRCLLVNLLQDRLADDGYELMCETVRHLAGELARVKPRVEKLIAQGRILRDDFRYPDIPNGCEVVP